MKIFKKRYLPFFAFGLMAIILGGCLVSEETITPNTAQPTFSGNSKVETTPPTVSSISGVTGAQIGELTATLNTYRLYVNFSEDMDSNTINTNTISIRNLTSGTPNALTGYTVAYDTTNMTLKRAIIEYTNSTTAGPTYSITAMEVVVTSEAKDLAGNGIAGLNGVFVTGPALADSELDKYTEHEYRFAINAAADYEPTRITSMTMSDISSVLVDFTVTFSTANVDAATIADTDFAISPDIKSTCIYDANDLNTAGLLRIQFTGCTATANTEYTLTFTPAATFATTSQYPDAATAVSKTHIFDTRDNAAGQSDFVQTFITLFNDDVTADGSLPSATIEADLDSNTVTVSFSKAMDKTKVVDTGNYTVLGTPSTNPSATPIEVQVDITPVLTLNAVVTDTEIRSIEISTANHSNYDITDIIYSTNLTSSILLPGEVFDQNGNNKAELLNDYNRDGQPDEW